MKRGEEMIIRTSVLMKLMIRCQCMWKCMCCAKLIRGGFWLYAWFGTQRYARCYIWLPHQVCGESLYVWTKLALFCWKKIVKRLFARDAWVCCFQTAARLFMKAGSSNEAVQLLLAAERWGDAHALAQTCMKPDEITALYINTAQQQEAKGKFREAER